MIADLFKVFRPLERVILLLLFSCNLAAAPGDRLTVTVNIANVRAGPSTDYPVLLKLDHDSEVIEIQRRDGWVEIEYIGTTRRSGWIHAPLLNKAPADETTATPDQEAASDPLYDLFKRAYAEFNARIKARTGKVYFATVENPGNRVIRLTVTDDWLNLTRPERDEQLNEIFTIWDAAVGDGIPITVDLIDRDGTRLMSKFRQE